MTLAGETSLSLVALGALVLVRVVLVGDILEGLNLVGVGGSVDGGTRILTLGLLILCSMSVTSCNHLVQG